MDDQTALQNQRASCSTQISKDDIDNVKQELIDVVNARSKEALQQIIDDAEVFQTIDKLSRECNNQWADLCTLSEKMDDQDSQLTVLSLHVDALRQCGAIASSLSLAAMHRPSLFWMRCTRPSLSKKLEETRNT
eukprot:2740526-Karenia_brevis.AAC.1